MAFTWVPTDIDERSNNVGVLGKQMPKLGRLEEFVTSPSALASTTEILM